MAYVDDGIFLGNYDSKLQDAINKIQDLGLNIEDQDQPTTLVSTSRNYQMIYMSSPNGP
jgi:hypothetical protein